MLIRNNTFRINDDAFSCTDFWNNGLHWQLPSACGMMMMILFCACFCLLLPCTMMALCSGRIQF